MSLLIKGTKIASSGSIAGLEKLLNQYYYSSTYKILPDLSIRNSKGIFDKIFIEKKKNRYTLYHKK